MRAQALALVQARARAVVPLPPAARRAGLAAALCAVLCALLWAAGATPAVAGSVQVRVLDGTGAPVRDAVVFLDSPQASRLARPLAGAEIGQRQRQFEPAVLVVPVGTQVAFPNRDTVRHHVYSFSPAKKFELKLYAGTPANPVLFDKPGVVVLGCNIHDDMVGWVVVVDTPYFTRTQATGEALIDNVPPGNYLLRAWHNALPVGAPALEQPVTVPASGSAAALLRMQGLQP